MVLQRHEERRNRGLAQFLAPNSALLRRLSITPDADWKSSAGRPGASPEESAKQRIINQVEPPLHFFEVDAYIAAEKDQNTIMLLPMGEYLDIHKGLRMMTSSWRRIDDNAIPARAKPVGAYLNAALAADRALAGDRAFLRGLL